VLHGGGRQHRTQKEDPDVAAPDAQQVGTVSTQADDQGDAAGDRGDESQEDGTFAQGGRHEADLDGGTCGLTRSGWASV
jgi:hypothetical protein